jgi:MerR family transcriptional regulator, heat shock protein HspR
MADKTREVIVWRTGRAFLSLEDLASAVGVHPGQVEQFVDYGLLEPSAGRGLRSLFPASSVERLRRIMRLKCDLGVNLAGIAIILEMRERILSLQHDLERLQGGPDEEE